MFWRFRSGRVARRGGNGQGEQQGGSFTSEGGRREQTEERVWKIRRAMQKWPRRQAREGPGTGRRTQSVTAMTRRKNHTVWPPRGGPWLLREVWGGARVQSCVYFVGSWSLREASADLEPSVRGLWINFPTFQRQECTGSVDYVGFRGTVTALGCGVLA